MLGLGFETQQCDNSIFQDHGQSTKTLTQVNQSKLKAIKFVRIHLPRKDKILRPAQRVGSFTLANTKHHF